MNPTLVFIRHHQIEGHQFHHGDELPIGLLSQHEIDKMIDAGQLQEHADRRSLYRLFPLFSGAPDQEHLTNEELTELALEA
jgi:hypothetical protein